MEQTNSTPLPNTVTQPVEKSQRFSMLNKLVIFLVSLFVIILLINIVIYFAKNKSAKYSLTPAALSGKVVLPCPVPEEFCKNPKLIKTESVPSEKTPFIALQYILPENEPVLAVKSDIFYHTIHTAGADDSPSAEIKNQTVINADFYIGSAKYRIGYNYEGVDLANTKKYNSGEQIGTMKSLSGESPFFPKGGANGSNLRMLIFYVKDLQKNVYLNLKITEGGKMLEQGP